MESARGFGQRKPLDDLHRPAALRAGPRGGSWLDLCGAWSAIGWSGRSQAAEANRQQGGAPSAGQKAEVPDAHKALGKQV